VITLDAFAARKTAEAERASINRFETEIDRGEPLVAIGNAWSRR
jgi:hypothetical protein